MAYTNHAMHGRMICMFSTCATAISFFPTSRRWRSTEPHHIYVTVKQGYNATHLRKQGVIVHTVSPEIFTLGLTSATTTFGNTVPTYDRERTLCDVIRQRGAMDVQTYQTAIREYMLHGHKNLPHLIRCSRALKVEDDVRRYLEVFLL